MKGRALKYSDAEMVWLEANRLLVISDYAAAFNAAFRRDVSAQNLHALRKRKGWKTGRTGCFAKGQEPFNKGKPHPGTAKSIATQFKKGNAPHNTRYLGHERMSKDGYVEISVAETNPHTGYDRRYVHKHVHLWEAANGPVPEGHCLKCLDGDKTNTDPANWHLIPRGVLARLNGGRHKKRVAYDAAAAELKPVLMTLAKVEHEVSEIRQRKAAA